jgi:hypothetical protein
MLLISLCLLIALGVAQGAPPPNWSANRPPCNRHAELLKRGHMDLGVRVGTTNLLLAEQFRRAMDSWARILDLDWHEDNTDTCSIQVFDGDPDLFRPAVVAARSQLPDRNDFQGWIAFNPAQSLSETDMYRISLHEIGHMLGLPHSSNATSVMYFLDLDGLDSLDPTDLSALARRHKLRIAALDKAVAIADAPAIEAGQK